MARMEVKGLIHDESPSTAVRRPGLVSDAVGHSIDCLSRV